MREGWRGLLGTAGPATVSDAERTAELFRQVVIPHLPDALAFARWLTGNRHDAEDVVQDACLKAHAGMANYAGGNPRAWLLTIVRRTCYTWLARNRRRDLVPVGDLADLDAVSGPPEAGGTDPEVALIEKAEMGMLEKAILALPEGYREVVVMRDVNGLSYREIATILAVPLGTVMSRLSRARGHLISEIRKNDGR